MDDSVNNFRQRDTDCTSRSLATLLVAWVGAAMVASVLLRWKYMWIALAILTLLFLIACGYAACNARRAHRRIVARGERPVIRRRSIEHVQTVSRVVDANYVVDPPAYRNFWPTDLPPSYATVVRSQPSVSLPNYHLTSADELAVAPRLSNPPPYSEMIQSDALNPQNGQPELHLQNFQGINQSVAIHSGQHIVRTQSFSEITNEDKEPKERRRSRSTGAGYLSNIINCTFARGERRDGQGQIDHQTPPISDQRVATNQINSGSNNPNHSKN